MRSLTDHEEPEYGPLTQAARAAMTPFRLGYKAVKSFGRLDPSDQRSLGKELAVGAAKFAGVVVLVAGACSTYMNRMDALSNVADPTSQRTLQVMVDAPDGHAAIERICANEANAFAGAYQHVPLYGKADIVDACKRMSTLIDYDGKTLAATMPSITGDNLMGGFPTRYENGWHMRVPEKR